MSTKYHINSNGEVKPCRATKTKCRFGGASGIESHYETREEAEKAISKKYSSQANKSFTKNKVSKDAKSILGELKDNGVRVKNIKTITEHNFNRGKNFDISNVDVIDEKLPNNFMEDLKLGKFKNFR